jgi:hypothetical protein
VEDGLLVALPVFPEDDVAFVPVLLSPDSAELFDEECAVASPELDAACASAALSAAAALIAGCGTGLSPPLLSPPPEEEPAAPAAAPEPPDEDGPPVPAASARAAPLVALLPDEAPEAPFPPGPDVAVLVEELLEFASPVLPPRPVDVESDDPELPEDALPLDDELAGPELPPVAFDSTSPESPEVTSTAMPPVPPPAPPPAPPLLAPEPPLLPDVPLLFASPPSPLDAVESPLEVASPVSPLFDVDVVVVVDEPEDEPEPDDEFDVAVPLTAGSSTVRTTLATALGGSSISAAAMAAANAIFSNMARSVLSAVTCRDAGQGLLATVLADVLRDPQSPPAPAGQDHRDQGQQGEDRHCGVDEQGQDAGAAGVGQGGGPGDRRSG